MPAGQRAQTAEDVVSLEVAPARAYDPIGHATAPAHAGVVSPVVEPNVPAGHNEQSVAPAREYVPRPQVPEQVDTLSPGVDPKLPAAQEPQFVAEPTTFDVAPAKAYLPAGHVRTPVHEEDFKPVVDPYVPAGQSAQVEVFVMDEFVAPASAYRPVAHVTVPEHAAVVKPEVTPNVPAGHEIHIEEPCTEYVPAEQMPVHVDDVIPDVAPYEPAVQFIQTAVFVTSLDGAPARAYLPAGHVTEPEHDDEVNPTESP